MKLSTPENDFRFRHIQALIVKVTQRCNLSCKYCYENVSRIGKDMDIEIFKNLVDRVMANSINGNILFIFHGGEPTLLPNSWFETAINYANSKAGEFNKNCGYAIQSNILSINDSKIDLFKKLNIDVGVSIDGPASINNGTLRGNETITIANIKKIQNKGLKLGILTTINHLNYGKFRFIIDWLYYDLHIKAFKANVAFSVGAGVNIPDLSDDKIYKAQKDILDYMVETKGTQVLERNLCFEITRFFEQDNSINKITLCDDRVCGAGKRVFGINLNGELLPCGRFEWNENQHNLGGLNNISLHDGLETKRKVSEFHNLVRESWNDCNTCNARKVCRYSCQAFIVRSNSQKNVECGPMKRKYQYFLENKESLVPVYEKITGSQVNSVNFSYDLFE